MRTNRFRIKDLHNKLSLILLLAMLTTCLIAMVMRPGLYLLEISSVYVGQGGAQFEFADKTGYFVETTDGNIWHLLDSAKPGDMLIMNDAGTETPTDDIIVSRIIAN